MLQKLVLVLVEETLFSKLYLENMREIIIVKITENCGRYTDKNVSTTLSE